MPESGWVAMLLCGSASKQAADGRVYASSQIHEAGTKACGSSKAQAGRKQKRPFKQWSPVAAIQAQQSKRRLDFAAAQCRAISKCGATK